MGKAGPRNDQGYIREAAEENDETDMVFSQTLLKHEQALRSDRDAQGGEEGKACHERGGMQHHAVSIAKTSTARKTCFFNQKTGKLNLCLTMPA